MTDKKFCTTLENLAPKPCAVDFIERLDSPLAPGWTLLNSPSDALWKFNGWHIFLAPSIWHFSPVLFIEYHTTGFVNLQQTRTATPTAQGRVFLVRPLCTTFRR